MNLLIKRKFLLFGEKKEKQFITHFVIITESVEHFVRLKKTTKSLYSKAAIYFSTISLLLVY